MANIDKWGPLLKARLERQKKEERHEQNRLLAQFREIIDSGDCLNLEVLLLEGEPSGFPQGSMIHVADVCFGSGPGGGDYRRYELEQSDSSDSWTLWWSTSDEWTSAYYEWCKKLEEYEDSDEDLDAPIQPRLYSLQARADTKPHAAPRKVAYEMLRACWALEPWKWDTDFSLLSVDQGGILRKQELFEIRDEILQLMNGKS